MVKRAAVDGSEALVAFIAASPPLSSAEIAALDGRLRQRLPFHLIPALIQQCRALPKTAQGEVLQQCLPASIWVSGQAACRSYWPV